jgi:hypothetical protein
MKLAISEASRSPWPFCSKKTACINPPKKHLRVSGKMTFQRAIEDAAVERVEPCVVQRGNRASGRSSRGFLVGR